MLSFFPLDVLDEIWDLIESVSEGCLTYSCGLGFCICVFRIHHKIYPYFALGFDGGLWDLIY